MEKRAELTTKQLVTIIILIASFVIVLFLLFRLNLGKTSNEEICKNSIALRGVTKVFSGPLDCETNYLCVSGGAKCTDASASEVKINSENKQEIMHVLANEMSSCWSQFGEGKVNYLGIADKDAWPKNSCAVCSVIEFDSKIQEKSTISYRELYNYLASTKKDTETYFSYLYDTNDVQRFQDNVSYLKVSLDNDLAVGPGKYAIVTGVKSGAIWGTTKGDIFIYPYLVKSTDINSQFGCDEFLTKA